MVHIVQHLSTSSHVPVTKHESSTKILPSAVWRYSRLGQNDDGEPKEVVNPIQFQCSFLTEMLPLPCCVTTIQRKGLNSINLNGNRLTHKSLYKDLFIKLVLVQGWQGRRFCLSDVTRIFSRLRCFASSSRNTKLCTASGYYTGPISIVQCLHPLVLHEARKDIVTANLFFSYFCSLLNSAVRAIEGGYFFLTHSSLYLLYFRPFWLIMAHPSSLRIEIGNEK